MKDQTSPWYTETSDDRLERIRSHWQRGFAVGSPNSQMRPYDRLSWCCDA